MKAPAPTPDNIHSTYRTHRGRTVRQCSCGLWLSGDVYMSMEHKIVRNPLLRETC